MKVILGRVRSNPPNNAQEFLDESADTVTRRRCFDWWVVSQWELEYNPYFILYPLWNLLLSVIFQARRGTLHHGIWILAPVVGGEWMPIRQVDSAGLEANRLWRLQQQQQKQKQAAPAPVPSSPQTSNNASPAPSAPKQYTLEPTPIECVDCPVRLDCRKVINLWHYHAPRPKLARRWDKLISRNRDGMVCLQKRGEIWKQSQMKSLIRQLRRPPVPVGNNGAQAPSPSHLMVLRVDVIWSLADMRGCVRSVVDLVCSSVPFALSQDGITDVYFVLWGYYDGTV